MGRGSGGTRPGFCALGRETYGVRALARRYSHSALRLVVPWCPWAQRIRGPVRTHDFGEWTVFFFGKVRRTKCVDSSQFVQTPGQRWSPRSTRSRLSGRWPVAAGENRRSPRGADAAMLRSVGGSASGHPSGQDLRPYTGPRPVHWPLMTCPAIVVVRGLLVDAGLTHALQTSALAPP